jgi:hypothetical protein
VHVDNITRSTVDNNVTNASGLFGANSGSSPNITWIYSGGCSTGAPLTSGSYKIYYTNNATGCNSQPAYFCAAGNGPNALAGSVTVPVITSPSNGIYTPAATTLSGTTTASATLYLYINGVNTKTTTAAPDGTFSFTNLSFTSGDQFYITAELNTGTVGTSYCSGKTSIFTVTCFTSAPVINVGSTNQLVIGLPITGTSADAAGTTIKVYTSVNTLVATTSVQNDGSWSTGNAGTTPSTYNAVAATSYYANAQNGSCGVSSNSSTFASASQTSNARCGTLPASLNESATSVSGTLSGTALAGTVVTLYEDGISIGSFTTANSSWGPIAVNTTVNNTIYAGAVLTIGITEPSKTEIICGASVTVSCTPPAAAIITPLNTNIVVGQTVTYTVSSPLSGILYSLWDVSDAVNTGTSKFGSGSSITVVTYTFNTPGTYTVNVKAISFSGANCESLSPATVVVSGVLPVSLLNFEGKYHNGNAMLHWSTSSEQNLKSFELQKSYSGNNFSTLADIKASGNSQVVQNYFYNDSLLTTGIVYYRLKMIDADNINFKYSNVIALHIDKGITINSISPNPFSEAIHMNISLPADVSLAIKITDITGKSIRAINYDAKKGSNNIILPGFNNLIRGTYVIELSTGGENISRQLIIKQ